MIGGWIKLHRSMVNWEWYDDKSVFRLFMHLLLTVNYKPQKFRGRIIPVGSRVFGLDKLSTETGLSVRQLRTALNKL